ncbi:hypothetical protein [Streptomyces sp. B8F3]|uniref:hypothetical protein n=1 Tax=unclassified Streptomyces TaxID=2593676 RepID=UPI00325C7219
MTITTSRKMLGLLGASIAVLSLPVLAATPSSAAAPDSTARVTSGIGTNDIGTKGRPSGCDYGIWDGLDATWAMCDDDNGGSWRAIALCKSTEGKILYGYGQWTKGAVSVAYCNGDSKVKSAGIETTTKDMTR